MWDIPAPASAIATASIAAAIAALRRVMLASLGARLLIAIRPSTPFGWAGWQAHRRRPGCAKRASPGAASCLRGRSNRGVEPEQAAVGAEAAAADGTRFRRGRSRPPRPGQDDPAVGT